MAYEVVLSSSISEIPFTGFSFGGVKVSMVRDSFIDNFSRRSDNEFDLTRLYEDTEGEFEFNVKGPSASGVLYILNQIGALIDRSTRYTKVGHRFPLYLRCGGIRAYLKYCELELGKNVSSVGALQAVLRNKIRYVRRGLAGVPISTIPDLTLFTSNSIVNDRPITTSLTPAELISSPMDIDIKLFNLRNTMPSGILLFTNNIEYLTVASGQVFNLNNGVDFFPSQVRLYNEDANGAYSVYSAFSTGVLGISQNVTSNGTNPIVTSGIVNIGTLFTSNKADFYATVKTTSSGFKCIIQVLGDQDENVILQTDPLEIGYIKDPTPIYLGSFYAQSTLQDTNLALKMTPVAGSGVLLLDRFIVHGVPDENGRSIQVDGFQKQVTSASGNNYIRILSNYFPSLSTNGGIYPTLYARREESQDYKWVEAPSYRGNILLFSRLTDDKQTIPVQLQTSNALKFLFLATGHAFPASGIKWVHQDAHNMKTRVLIQPLKMSRVVNLLIPPD